MPFKKITNRIVVFLPFLVLLFAAMGNASDDEIARSSLKGLNGVYVTVEDLQPDAEKAGLTKSSIQTDVELKLRMAGIPVLKGSRTPFLYVALNSIELSQFGEGIVAYNINVELNQDVYLARDPNVHSVASTWSTGFTGIIRLDNIQLLRDHDKDKVDDFISAYLSVNPK